MSSRYLERCPGCGTRRLLFPTPSAGRRACVNCRDAERQLDLLRGAGEPARDPERPVEADDGGGAGDD